MKNQVVALDAIASVLFRILPSEQNCRNAARQSAKIVKNMTKEEQRMHKSKMWNINNNFGSRQKSAVRIGHER